MEVYLNDLLCAQTKCPCSFLEAWDLTFDDEEELIDSDNESAANEPNTEKNQEVTCNGKREISQVTVAKWPRLLAVEFSSEAANHEAGMDNHKQKKHTLDDL